jgi:Leucine-rich repeat (LRR) protein
MNDTLEIIAQITSLRELKITDNMLSGELTCLESLHNLEILEVQSNKLSSLPEELSSLSKLRILNVSSNVLTDLPVVALSKIPTLVELLASKNKICGSLFTLAGTTMPRLQILDVSINQLSDLYDGSAGPELPSLKELNIAYNQITSLPSIASWTSLSTIRAADNKISTLPYGFTESTSVRSADFTGNDFSKLDERLALMDGLDNFQVAANPLRERKYLTMKTDDLKQSLRAKLGPVSFLE